MHNVSLDRIHVVCGIIFNNQQVFICRRKPHKSFGGFWEFPGGKIEDGESAQDCLIRELFEELEMHVKIGEHYKTVSYQHENYIIELSAFYCDYIDCNYNLTDHDLYEWVNIIDLDKWKLAPADVPIASDLITNYKNSKATN